MAYTINKTDTSTLATVTDGTINTTASSLTLIGKSYSNWGELNNENLVKLLENSAGTSAPTVPIIGELWFDTSTSSLKVYNGNDFVPTGNEKGLVTTNITNGDIVIQPNGTGVVEVDSIQVNGDSITSIITNASVDITGNGTGGVNIESISVSGTTITSDDSSQININENLNVDGNVVVTGTITGNGSGLTNVTASAVSESALSNVIQNAGPQTIDNLTFNDSEISSSSNADINITAGGTGAVNFNAIQIKDSNISGTRSNEDLILSASGTGNILLGALRVNGTTISSDNSSAIKINETLHVNRMKSDDSSALHVEDNLTVEGVLQSDALVSNVALIGSEGAGIEADQSIDMGSNRYALIHINADVTINFTNIQNGTVKRIFTQNEGTTTRTVSVQLDGSAAGSYTVGDGSTVRDFNLIELISFTNGKKAVILMERAD